MEISLPIERRNDVEHFVAELAVALGLPEGKCQPVVVLAQESVNLLRAVKSRQEAGQRARRSVNRKGLGHWGLVVERTPAKVVVYRAGSWTRTTPSAYKADEELWMAPLLRASVHDLTVVEVAVDISPRLRPSALAMRLS